MNFGGYIRNRLLVLADLLCIYGVWAAMVLGYRAVGIGWYDPRFYLRMWPVGLVFVLINGLFRLYHGSWFYPSVPYSPVEELRRLVGSSILTHLLVVAYLVLAYQTTHYYSRFIIFTSGFLVAFLTQPMRDLMRALMFRLGFGRIPVILSGGGRTAQVLGETLRNDRYLGLRVVRSVDDGDSRTLLEVGRELGVRILIDCRDPRLLRAQMPELTRWYRHIESIPMAESFPVFGSRIVALGGFGGIEMVNQGRMAFIRLEKWLLDKALAVLAMVSLFPLFVIIPILIKLTSRGSVFYRQDRLGLRGRPIRVWKFRSMYADADTRLKAILENDPAAAAEWKLNFKLRNDPRLTPLGRILRKTSLDELPQLFNVFVGNMAIVGPRPIVQAEVKYYGSSYEVFSSVLPGITGLWQASGRSDTDYDQRVALDVQYVLNWSPWLDVWIIIRTAFSVILMRGAC